MSIRMTRFEYLESLPKRVVTQGTFIRPAKAPAEKRKWKFVNGLASGESHRNLKGSVLAFTRGEARHQVKRLLGLDVNLRLSKSIPVWRADKVPE